MHRILTTFVIFLICFLSASAHDRKFSFSAIPPQLLENSNSVIRMRETTIDIKSAGKAVMTVAYAVTILKENAVENAILFLGYNKFTSIRNLNGYVYDKNGEKVERIEREKFLDYSAISYFSTYEDN
ncbi:MAG: DUF3857 domain-containing protein [Bacteroidetes bacterium]|nr:DUF3857 domain-containing protein [Bacteroidota bacterium]